MNYEEQMIDLAVIDKFPFLSEFPFSEYKISQENNANFLTNLINPNDDDEDDEDEIELVFSNENDILGDIINFSYSLNKYDIIVSFHVDDIHNIYEQSVNITKIDSVREAIDEGLSSMNIVDKLNGIETGKEFIRKVNSEFIEPIEHDRAVLELLCTIRDIEISEELKDIILSDKIWDIKVKDLDVLSIKAIMSYLDFQLHHAKMILGIVIAAKIY